jgi:hypothetical protein
MNVIQKLSKIELPKFEKYPSYKTEYRFLEYPCGKEEPYKIHCGVWVWRTAAEKGLKPTVGIFKNFKFLVAYDYFENYEKSASIE